LLISAVHADFGSRVMSAVRRSAHSGFLTRPAQRTNST